MVLGGTCAQKKKQRWSGLTKVRKKYVNGKYNYFLASVVCKIGAFGGFGGARCTVRSAGRGMKSWAFRKLGAISAVLLQ